MKRSTGAVSSAGLSRTAAIVLILAMLAACSPAPRSSAPPAADASAPAADAAAPPPATAAASEAQADAAAPAPATGSSEMASTAPAEKIIRPSIAMKSTAYAASSHSYATAAAIPPPAKMAVRPPETSAEIARVPPPPAPPTTTPAAPGPPITADADNLATRQVAYNKPKTLTYGEATPVQVVINANGQAMSEAFENLPGDVKTHNVLVSPEMTAELTGPAERVKIQLRTGYPPWQKVTKLGNPTWIWDVTALAPGMTRVDLAIKAKVDTGAAETVIRTYHDSIPVRMGVVDSIKWWIAQIDPIWKWIIGVATVLGGALLWWRTNMKPKVA